MSLCLLEFWVPQHEVSSTFTLVWGLGHVFEGKLYFTKDIVDDSFVPTCTPPPPRVVPHPLSFPGGGGAGGASLGQPKIFRCGSLCCCVGGCVVGHYHLHPLHSWQDILLTFAEMELDNTTMFPPGTSVMFIRSTGEPVLAQVVGHLEHGDAYRRISYDRDGKTVLHDRASVVCGAWDTVLGTSCILQGTFPKGNGFPKICLRLPSLLPRRQNHHPRVLPKALEWKVVSMCKSSR